MGAFADYLLTQALQIESAALVSMARGFDMVTSFVHQAIFTQDHIYPTSVYGAVIVVVSVLVNASLKFRDEKRQTAQSKLYKQKVEKEMQIAPEVNQLGFVNPVLQYAPEPYTNEPANEQKQNSVWFIEIDQNNFTFMPIFLTKNSTIVSNFLQETRLHFSVISFHIFYLISF